MKTVFLVNGYYDDIQKEVTLRVYANEEKAKEYAQWLVNNKSEFKGLTEVTIWEEDLW